MDEESKIWINPALNYLISTLEEKSLKPEKPLSRETVEQMIAWEF
jgi:hypothetical protein